MDFKVNFIPPMRGRVYFTVAKASRIFDIVLILVTAGLSVALLAAGSDPTSNGLTFVGLLALSAFPLAIAVIVRVIRAALKWRDRGWRSVVSGSSILLLHPAAVAVAFLATYFGWASEMRFAWSRGSLENAAREAVASSNPNRDEVRWIGLYRTEGVKIDEDGRIRFQLGDCSMFATCELVFDPRIDCASNLSRDDFALDRQWCVDVHDLL